MIRIPSLARLALPAVVTLSLAFGARQAVAAPAEAAEVQACLKYECMTYCQSRGGEGYCFNDTCVCRIRHE
jgi:hypothetical protein